MIPSNRRIRRKLPKGTTIPKEDYFAIAEEFVTLQKIFVNDSMMEKMKVWMDMLIYPIFLIVYAIWNAEFPSVFSLFSFQKCYVLWTQWFRFRTLGQKIREWTKLVKSIGGPWISSNDAEYHVFVYADGMERISLALSEKRTKRSK